MGKKYFKKMNQMMKLWRIPFVAGIFLILMGLGIVFTTELKILSIIIGGFLFMSGLLGVVYIYYNKKRLKGWGFYLVLAILDFLFAFLLINVLEPKVIILSRALSIWIILQGLGKIVFSLDIQKLGVSSWDSDLTTGMLFVLYGITCTILMSVSPMFFLLTTAIVLFLAGLFQIFLSLERQTEQKNYMRDVKFMFSKNTLSEVRTK